MLVALLSAAAFAFEPAKTHAVVVGVLKWQDPKISSFSGTKRKDRELMEQLHAMGVPEANTRLLLDEQATLANVIAAIEAAVAKVKAGETLIFYYAGHGAIERGKELVLLNYDYDGKEGLSAKRITSALAGFKGARVLLFGDCCHSGGLARVAEAVAKDGKVRAASLTSAEDSNISTGNWTYTLTLLDGLRGKGIVDADGDGHVTLGEIGAEVRDAMKNRERQRHGFALHGVDAGLRIAKAENIPAGGEAAFALKEYVLVWTGKKDRVGRVIGIGAGRYTIQLQGYADRDILITGPKRLRKLTFRRYPKDADIEVLWGAKLWKAKVVETDGDFHRITYPGWDAVWDEWVLSDRIRVAKDAAEKIAACGGRYSNLLKRIEVKADVAKYGLFNEEGHFELTEWAGHKNLPAGYWVYVYPDWFIWRDRK